MKIGVISDTHNFFDPQLPGLFAGVEHILHAGDIGLPGIVRALEQIAPVTAVGGNTDDPGFNYPLTMLRELTGRKFLLQHIVNPHSPDAALRAQIVKLRPSVVVFGHSHKPFCETFGVTLFLNPGYAGKSRFGLPRTVALLFADERGVRAEFLRL